MRKVLIISYFYPPSYFVGGKRVAAWAEHLHASGVYPIIITRKWNPNQSEITDKVIDNGYKHQKGNTHELYQLPYVYSLRDRLHQKNRWPLLRKALTFMEIFLSYFFISANKTHLSFYKKAIEVLENNPDIDTLIISGKPFQSFFIGYALKKKFPRLKWIPDFRDEWTSHPLFKHNTRSIFRNLDVLAERKWTSNADFIIAPDKTTASKIADKIQKKYEVIANGYDGVFEKKPASTSHDAVHLCYTGTIYANQNIELLVDAIRELNQNNIPVHMHWIGIDLAPDQGKRVRDYCAGNNSFFHFHLFADTTDLKELLKSIDLYVLLPYKEMSHVLPVKLYDYMFDGRPILFFPSDKGAISTVLEETKTGYSFENKADFKGFLAQYFQSKKDTPEFYNPIENEIAKYTRKNTVAYLANILRIGNN